MADEIFVSESHGKTRREATLRVGEEYVVQPLNPNKKKHRGRHCVILDFVAVSEFHPKDIVAKVRFLDNNRVGRAELSDLEPISEV
jgi:hypothetical protein